MIQINVPNKMHRPQKKVIKNIITTIKNRLSILSINAKRGFRKCIKLV